MTRKKFLKLCMEAREIPKAKHKLVKYCLEAVISIRMSEIDYTEAILLGDTEKAESIAKNALYRCRGIKVNTLIRSLEK